MHKSSTRGWGERVVCVFGPPESPTISGQAVKLLTTAWGEGCVCFFGPPPHQANRRPQPVSNNYYNIRGDYTQSDITTTTSTMADIGDYTHSDISTSTMSISATTQIRISHEDGGDGGDGKKQNKKLGHAARLRLKRRQHEQQNPG